MGACLCSWAEEPDEDAMHDGMPPRVTRQHGIGERVGRHLLPARDACDAQDDLRLEVIEVPACGSKFRIGATSCRLRTRETLSHRRHDVRHNRVEIVLHLW
jgi:hypothetical protein